MNMKLPTPARFVVARYLEDGHSATPASAVFDIYGERDNTFITRIIDTVCSTKPTEFYIALRKTSPDPINLMQLVGCYAVGVCLDYKATHEEGDCGLCFVTTFYYEGCDIAIIIPNEDHGEDLMISITYSA